MSYTPIPRPPDWSDISDVKNPVIRRSYIRGAVRNGFEHAKAGVQARYHIFHPRGSIERRELLLKVAYSRGYWRLGQKYGQKTAQ